MWTKCRPSHTTMWVTCRPSHTTMWVTLLLKGNFTIFYMLAKYVPAIKITYINQLQPESSIEYIYTECSLLVIAHSTHLLWIKISDITVTNLGNICQELSPLNYRWRFSSSGPGSFIMISQHAITVSATGIYQWIHCLIFHIST
jgi:hypothetical protein